MPMPRIAHILVLLLAVLAAAAPAAHASRASDRAIADCYEDGKLDGRYSDAVLAEAIRDLPTDIDQYSDCREILRAARNGGQGNQRRSGVNPNPPPPDPSLSTEAGAAAWTRADLDALNDETGDRRGVRDRKAPRIDVAGTPVLPERASNELPTPALSALIVLGGIALLATLLLLGRRAPAIGRGLAAIPRGALRLFRR